VKSPKTSILTCSYNRPALLREALTSVRRQSDADWEHLIYDDASTDLGMIPVLNEAMEDPRVQVWQAPMNRDRPAVLWNRMIGAANGRYIAILDDDNRYMPFFLATMTAPMEANQAIEAVSCGWRTIGDWTPMGGECHWNLETTLAKLYRNNTIDSGALVFRRSVIDKIGDFNETLRTNEDWHFVIRLVRHCRVLHLREPLLEYRVHKDARSKRAEALGSAADCERIRQELFTQEERAIF
jgi:glycosyltransferase involved in cell wall biosynthesis